MPKKTRATSLAQPAGPLAISLKATPSRVALGVSDSLLQLSLINQTSQDLTDLQVEWDFPAWVLGVGGPALPSGTVGQMGRSSGPRTLEERRGRGSLPAGPGTAPRLMALAPVQHFPRLAADAALQVAFGLRSGAVGRFALRVRRVSFRDADGNEQELRPEVVTWLVVEEPIPPQLEVSARCLKDAVLGEALPVELRVDNRGNLAARSLHIAFDLPSGIRLADAPLSEGGERPTRVQLGPIDVEGRRHRLLRIQLLPQGPGEMIVEEVHLTYLAGDGARLAVPSPPAVRPPLPRLPASRLPAEAGPSIQEVVLRPGFRLQLAMRLDPSRVFVGRSRHRDKLDRLLTSVALPGEQAAARVVLLAGRAGIGKSRLVDEVKTRARLGGYLVADTRLLASASGLASGLMRGLATSLFDLAPLLSRPAAPLAVEVERHLELLGLALPPLLLRGLTALVESLRPAAASAPSLGLDAAVADPAGFLTDAIRHLTRLQPLLLTVDDVHCLAPPERRLLSRLLAGTRDCRLLAILTYREENFRDISEFVEHLKSDTGATQLRLGALNYEACRALVSENFAGANFPDWLVAAIHTRSRGVPLYEVEALRCLVQRGTVRFDVKEGWKADEQRSADLLAELPGTANGLIARQVAWLRSEDPEAHRILQDVAVLGPDATLELLAALHPAERGVLGERVHGLVARGFLKSPGSPHVPLEFAHPLKKEVALPNSLEQQMRHRDAAQALARLSAEGHAGSIASHLLAADCRGEALGWCVRWAQRAQAQGASQEALQAYEKSLQLFDDPEAREHRSELSRLDLLRPLLRLLMERGGARRSLEVAESLHELARLQGDRSAESEASVARARSLSRLGRDLEALQAFYAAIDLAEEEGLGALATTASLELAQHYRDRERDEPARRVLRSAAERFLRLEPTPRGDVDAVELVAALARLDCRAQAQEVWDAVFSSPAPGLETLRSQRARSYLVAYAEGEDAVCRLLEAAIHAWDHAAGAAPGGGGEIPLRGAPDAEAASWLELYSRALHLVGNAARSLEMLDASWARRGQQVSLRQRARYLEERSELLAALERGREAAAHAAEYIQVARSLDEPHMLCTALLNAAFLALSAGDVEGAQPLLEEGLATARERSMPSLLCRAQLLMADLEMARKNLEQAYAWCRQGRRLAEDHGLSTDMVTMACIESARCRAAMGEVAEAAADCATEARRLEQDGQASHAVRCLRMQAGFLLELERLEDAHRALEHAVALPSTRPGSVREREQAYRDLCEIRLRQRDLEGAAEALDLSMGSRLPTVEISPAHPSVGFAATTAQDHLAALCERLQMMGQGEQARELLLRALQVLPEDDAVRRSQTLLAMARLEVLDDEPAKARSLLERALRTLGPVPRQRNVPRDTAEQQKLRVRVRVRIEQGRLDALEAELPRARKHLREACRIAARIDDLEALAYATAVLGRVYEDLGELEQAREAWTSILDKPQALALARLEACLGLARLEVPTGQAEMAVAHLRGAEEAALEAGWPGVAMLMQVAEAWEMLGRADQGLRLVERAISMVRLGGIEERKRLPGLLQTLARLHCELEPPQHREAVAAAEEAVETCRGLGDAASLGENLEGLAHILSISGDEGRAIEQLQAALRLFERPGQEAGAGRVHGHLARMHLQSGRPELASTHLEEALRLAHKVREQQPDVLADVLLTAATLEHELGHPERSSAHLLAYLELGLQNEDVSSCMLALHGLDEQPAGSDLSRVPAEGWARLHRLLQSTPPGEELVECLLAGVKGLESQHDFARRDQWMDSALDAIRRCSPNLIDPATLDELARALEKRGDILEASNVYRHLAARTELEEEVGDLAELRAYACGRAGEMLASLGLAEEALKLYHESERHAERVRVALKDPGYAFNAFAIGSIHFDEGRPEEARAWFAKAVTRWGELIERGVLEPEEHFQALGMLGVAHAYCGNEGEALATLERYRARIEQDARPFTGLWLGAACDLAEVLVRLERPAAASYALNEALPYLQVVGSAELACRTFTMLSWVAAEQKSFEVALQWSNRALARVADVREAPVALQTWVQGSMLNAWMRDASAAAVCQRQVIRLAAELGDWKLGLEQRESLVVSLAAMEDLVGAQAALADLEAARAEVLALQPEVSVARPRFARAVLALREGEPRVARDLLLADLSEVDGNQEEGTGEAAFLLSWLGTACHQAGDLEDAVALFGQCILGVRSLPAEGVRARERGFDDASLATVYLELAEVLARLGRWDEALASLEEARARSQADPWVARHLPSFTAALAARQVPPHADPLGA